jgi:group I intron endonuclease
MWKNSINGKRYIGSSENLNRRFSEFFYINYLKKSNYMYICRALLKHGYDNFSLTIIEYCDKEKCIEREKYYINLLGTEYNTVKDPTIPPMSGRKHSEESKTKISDAVKKSENPSRFKTGHKHSDESRTIISEANTGKKNPMYGKNHSDETKQIISDAMVGNTNKKGKPRAEGAGKPSQAIEVTDITNNTTISYDSISEAARALNCNESSIRRNLKSNSNKPYKNIYMFAYKK